MIECPECGSRNIEYVLLKNRSPGQVFSDSMYRCNDCTYDSKKEKIVHGYRIIENRVEIMSKAEVDAILKESKKGG